MASRGAKLLPQPEIHVNDIRDAGAADHCIIRRRALFAAWLGIVPLAVFVAWLRWHALEAIPSGLYREEFALQYRFARIAASGNRLPGIDRKLQWPEGVDVAAAYPTLMEQAAGLAYRMALRAGITSSFDAFLIRFQAVVSSLAVVACFGVVAAVRKEAFAAFAAAAIYGLSAVPVLRLVGSFGHETFALPLLFAGIASTAASFDERRGRWTADICAVFGATFFLLGLFAWHFSQIFLLLAAAATTTAFLSAAADNADRVARSTAILAAGLLIGASFSPLLKATGFITGPGVTLLTAVPATRFIVKRFGRNDRGKRLVVFVPAAGSLLLLSQALRSTEGTYGHVWRFAREWIVNLGTKPADPAVLPIETRILWSGWLHPPDLPRLLWSMWPAYLLLVIAGLRALYGVRQSSAHGMNAANMFVATLAIAFGAAHGVMERLAVVAVFFFSVVSAAAWSLPRHPLLRATNAAAFLLLALVMLVNFPATPIDLPSLRMDAPMKTTTAEERFSPLSQVDVSLLTFLRLDSPDAAAFVGRFNVIPPVLAYADRAIAIHSKFEVPGVREKVARHIESLYDSEDRLVEFMRQNRVTHCIHDPFTVLGIGPDSPRYLGDALRLRPDSPAFLMQFNPSGLKRLRLIYQNSFYRVYRLAEATEPASAAPVGAAGALFDLRTFEVDGSRADLKSIDDRAVQRVLVELQQATEALRQAIGLFSLGKFREALPLFDAALSAEPAIPYARSHRAWILWKLGIVDDAATEIDRALRDDPYDPQTWHIASVIRQAKGDAAGAEAAGRQAARLAAAADFSRIDGSDANATNRGH